MSMWKDAASKPDLLPFFKMAEESRSWNGKLFGTVQFSSLRLVDIDACDHDYYDDPPAAELSLDDVTYLHVVEELFDVISAYIKVKFWRAYAPAILNITKLLSFMGCGMYDHCVFVCLKWMFQIILYHGTCF